MMCLAAFVFAVLVQRARLLDFTIDEASTTLAFVLHNSPWGPATNNHLLNTLASRLIVQVLPVSVFNLRIPALIGAASYLVFSMCLCRRLVQGRWAQLALFAVFSLNPLVLDYLYVSRGYALGLGFELAALYFLSSVMMNPAKADRRLLMCASLMCGLAIMANFGFAPVMVGLCAAYAGLNLTRQSIKESFLDALSLAGPAAIILVIFAADSAVRVDLKYVWGALTYSEAISNLKFEMFQNYDDRIMPPLFNPLLKLVLAYLGVFLACTGVVGLGSLLAKGKLYDFPVLCGIALLVAGLWTHTLFLLEIGRLPLGRTELAFIPPLLLLFLPPIFALPGIGRPIGTAICFITAMLFIGNWRSDYILDWKYNADVGKAFAVADTYARSHGIDELQTTWRYESVSNFYRELLKSPIKEFPRFEDLTPGKKMYLVRPEESQFIENQNLKVIYQSPVSGVQVAVAE